MHVAWRASNQLGYASQYAWPDNVYKKMKLQFPTGLWANKEFENMCSGSQEGLFD
jgi:hypothetical protein